jgi:hypothetical protein
MIPRSRNLLATGLAATLAVTLPRNYAADRNLSAKPAKAGQPQLQLAVTTPPQWRPLLADDLADAFASRVADVLCRQGFNVGVAFIPSGDPDSGHPVLAIRLIHWRLGRTDSAECLFTATIQSGDKKEDLGAFENTHLPWLSGTSRRGLAEVLGDAADGALRELAGKLAQSGSVPWFQTGVQ